MSGNVAALDCGSNSTRLFICGPNGEPLLREMTITRLSAGVDESRTLLPDAMERTFDALRNYRQHMDAYHVSSGLLVATSAVRDALNGEEFLAQAREIVGVDARILTGLEEASYSYDGATADLADSQGTVVICDIGGGSTELAMRDADQVLHGVSLQLGCVRVTERALGPELVTEERATATTALIEQEIRRGFEMDPAFAAIKGPVTFLGLAGTVATLVQLEFDVRTYERERVHLQSVSYDRVLWWRNRLGALTPQERLELPGMVRGREDVIVSGLFILEAVMRHLGVASLLSCENDILDGVCASLRQHPSH
jgi:exopolyphosphatase/guanosine-5'-triphosphate,3'-diphosphate pyrophosphatase